MSELTDLIRQVEEAIKPAGYDWLLRSNMRPNGTPNGYFANISHPDARIGANIPCRHVAATMEQALLGSYISWKAGHTAAQQANDAANKE